MKLRIAVWAALGALVAVGWRFYLSATFPSPLLGTPRTLIDLTCPIALIRQYPVSFYSVLFANACTYALIGTVVELFRGHHKHPHHLQGNHAN